MGGTAQLSADEPGGYTSVPGGGRPSPLPPAWLGQLEAVETKTTNTPVMANERHLLHFIFSPLGSDPLDRNKRRKVHSLHLEHALRFENGSSRAAAFEVDYRKRIRRRGAELPAPRPSYGHKFEGHSYILSYVARCFAKFCGNLQLAVSDLLISAINRSFQRKRNLDSEVGHGGREVRHKIQLRRNCIFREQSIENKG